VIIDVDPDDRRNRLITLTASGRQRLADSDALWEKAQRGFELAFGRRASDGLREAMALLISDSFMADFEKGMSAAGARKS
jgi:DNA-binding MarR family transcriptional regulator